jgi:hypothetical protein
MITKKEKKKVEKKKEKKKRKTPDEEVRDVEGLSAFKIISEAARWGWESPRAHHVLQSILW